MSRVICVCNQKGGVGKTTTSVNLASCLALADKKCLLIDMDPQANASSGVGIRIASGSPSVYSFLIMNDLAKNVIRTSQIELLDVIPSSQDLTGAEVELVSMSGRERLLSSSLNMIRNLYDYVIVDCPPSLGFLTLNALVAADSVLIPVQCEYYALEGVGNLLKTIHRIRLAFNPGLKIEGFLLTMFDARNNLSHQVANDVRKNLGSQVFGSIIPRNVKLSEAPSFGKPVVLYDMSSTGAVSYLALSKEILDAEAERHSQKKNRTGTGS
jgi:chromosome partitioning protein